MLHITGAKNLEGKLVDVTLDSETSQHIDASGLTIFPGLIDPHVHFRTPGLTHKEDWTTAAFAALKGGYTTVFDMPNTLPPTITAELLQEKQALIDKQLISVNIPLRYHLYFGADKNHLDEIHKVRNKVIGIKVFMGCSTGNLVIDDDESLHAVFEIAAREKMLVAVHAEDEALIQSRKKQFAQATQYEDHSRIRNVEVACCAVEKAISLCEKYGTKLYILHVSSQEEIQLIKAAKLKGLPVYAETTPHHLFLNDVAYSTLQGKAVVNPPLRDEMNRAAVLDAVREGIIDTIGSDHAPHLETEKTLPYGQCPSGMPGIETTLPLLLTAYHQRLLTLERILALTCYKPREIFNLPENDDKIFVNMNEKRTLQAKDLKTKCQWSAFNGQSLQGWPIYVIFENLFYQL